MKFLLHVTRIIVGVLFIFSGLVKANDPLGLSYKMEEFFQALHITFLSPAVLGFSIVMIIFEIVAGIALLLGYRMKIFGTLLLLLMIFFTFLTGYAFLSGKIKECGCFGDCIPLTAEASFWKDVILLILVVFLFACRKHIHPVFNKPATGVLMLLGILLSSGIQVYALNHLPFVDCLPYRVGNNITRLMQPPPGAVADKFETVMIYEKDGVKKEFTMDNYPWRDSTWHFVDRKDKLIQKGNAIPVITDFAITGFTGNDSTRQILDEEGYTFLFLVLNTGKTGTGWEQKMASLQQDCRKNGIKIYGITASDAAATAQFERKAGLDFPFLQMDGTVIKTAGRSNPCLILLKHGQIAGKWHFHDMPSGAGIPAGGSQLKLQF